MAANQESKVNWRARSGRKLQHVFPFLYRYDRLPSAALDSLERPLFQMEDSDNRLDPEILQEVGAWIKNYGRLEEQVHEQGVKLSGFESDIQRLSSSQAVKMGEQEDAVEKLKEYDAVKERKLKEQAAIVAELKSTASLMKAEQSKHSEAIRKLAEIEEDIAELKSSMASLLMKCNCKGCCGGRQGDDSIRLITFILAFVVSMLIGLNLNIMIAGISPCFFLVIVLFIFSKIPITPPQDG